MGVVEEEKRERGRSRSRSGVEKEGWCASEQR